MPTTTGMKGGGYYDAHSKEQRAAVDVVIPWLDAAVQGLPDLSPAQSAWTVLDIGSSEGSNAVHAMRRVIAALRHRSDRPIQVVFDDLPTNDFNQLFHNLAHPTQPAFTDPDVFSAAIAGSAFQRLMPAASVHVATTFNAIGFLERRPEAPLPRYIVPVVPGPGAPRAGVGVSKAELEPFRIQAAADLANFYRVRLEELIRGGKLLVQVFGRNDLHSTSHGIYDVLSDAVLDLVGTGDLPEEVYRELVFPIFFRTLEDLVAPLREDPVLKQGFRVDKQLSYEVEAPFNAAFARTGDVGAWARDYTGFLRAFTESILARAIPDQANRLPLVDHVYRTVEERLTAEPARYEFHYVAVAALLTRQ